MQIRIFLSTKGPEDKVIVLVESLFLALCWEFYAASLGNRNIYIYTLSNIMPNDKKFLKYYSFDSSIVNKIRQPMQINISAIEPTRE